MHYTITEDWTGSKYAGIDLAWDYSKRTCHLSLDNYIKILLIKYGHTAPGKPQLSPHKHIPIQYGAKVQHLAPANTSLPLDDAGVRRTQGIVGALNWYGRATDNKLLVSFSAIGSQYQMRS